MAGWFASIEFQLREQAAPADTRLLGVFQQCPNEFPMGCPCDRCARRPRRYGHRWDLGRLRKSCLLSALSNTKGSHQAVASVARSHGRTRSRSEKARVLATENPVLSPCSCSGAGRRCRCRRSSNPPSPVRPVRRTQVSNPLRDGSAILPIDLAPCHCRFRLLQTVVD